MVGIVTRNFGLERLLTIQLVIALTLIVGGLLLNGNGYISILAVVMFTILASFRILAADVRQVLSRRRA